jgi:hypothetical protein
MLRRRSDWMGDVEDGRNPRRTTAVGEDVGDDCVAYSFSLRDSLRQEVDEDEAKLLVASARRGDEHSDGMASGKKRWRSVVLGEFSSGAGDIKQGRKGERRRQDGRRRLGFAWARSEE